jgi:hypothetical protein
MNEITILTPVYNDWNAFSLLLKDIEKMAKANVLKVNVFAVNDGSSQMLENGELGSKFPQITQLEVLHLSRNLGHQRAIAVGLAVLNARHVKTPIIVMDCDGEDRPADIPHLLEEHAQHPTQIIFAHRAARSEGIIFVLFYRIFKIIFRILTGKGISFGNFSLIPPLQIGRVAYLQEIWNHFAAGIMHSNLQWKTIPTQRGKRYIGKSQMNLVSLVLHGLSAISVYTEIVFVRLIFAALLVIFFDIIGFLVLLYIKYLTPLAIPGWGTSVAIGLVLVMLLAILFLTTLSFSILSYRSMKMFIPALDYPAYLRETEKII